MSIEKHTLLELLQKILREFGEDLGKDSLLHADEKTPLFGSRSELDSMSLVNFIAEIEERLSDDYNIDITLANASAMSRTRSPFLRVDSCVDYIIELINKDNNE